MGYSCTFTGSSCGVPEHPDHVNCASDSRRDDTPSFCAFAHRSIALLDHEPTIAAHRERRRAGRATRRPPAVRRHPRWTPCAARGRLGGRQDVPAPGSMASLAMRNTLVLTILAPDRTGLVELLAQRIAAAGGNWEESRMARLAGQFAGILLVTCEDARSDELVAAMRTLESAGLQVTARVTQSDPVPAPG